MTIYGWDASHYDGLLNTAILTRAKNEGIRFFTHKVGEGGSYDDPNDATALASARDAGIEFIGGYFVPRSGIAIADQVNYAISLADRDEPWWRNFPGWFWQVDLERWSYDNVPASIGIGFAQEIRRRTGRWTILYASNGQYSNSLTGWDGPLWNAHYTGATSGTFTAIYPGDGWRPSLGSRLGGWASYSGQEPTFLQYTSSATIAGLTTCDCNAFRGTVDDLRNLIEGGDHVGISDLDAQYLIWRVEALAHLFDPVRSGPEQGSPVQAVGVLRELQAGMKEVRAQLAALASAVAVGGLDLDVLTTALVERLEASGALHTDVDHDAIRRDIDAVLDAHLSQPAAPPWAAGT